MFDEKATTAEKLPTAAEFASAIDFVMKNKPEEWPLMINSIVVAALRKAEEIETNLKRLVFALLKQGVIKAQVSTPADATPDAPAAAAGVPAGSGAPRKGADGRDLTPQEAAIEEMMDQAPVDNSEPAPQLVGQGPAQKRRFAKGKHAPAAAASAGVSDRVGADGKPLTPQEAAIEQMMDEAPVVND